MHVFLVLFPRQHSKQHTFAHMLDRGLICVVSLQGRLACTTSYRITIILIDNNNEVWTAV